MARAFRCQAPSERWGLGARSMAVFEDQEAIVRPVLARFTDVCDRQFASLAARDRIGDYLEQILT